MPEKNPFEDLLDQLADLLRFAQEKVGQPIDPSKIPHDIKERLEKVNRDIQEFNNLSRKIIGLSDVSREEIDKRLAGKSEDLAVEGKDLIKKGAELRKQVEELKATVPLPPKLAAEEQAKKPAEAEPFPKTPMDEQKMTKRRKSKFRRFGGNKDWKPL